MDVSKQIERLRNLTIPEMTVQSAEYLENTDFQGTDRTVKIGQGVFRVVARAEHPGGTGCGVEVRLPAECNRVLVSLGNGGMGGRINHPLLAHYAALGYAVAHTDLGTSKGRESGIGSPDVFADFGYRANRYMTVAAKACFTALYGAPPDRSYFLGSSTGGEQALAIAQRYPGDYDGILAGKPANNRIPLHTYFLWNYVHLRDRDGSVCFTPEEAERITTLASVFFAAQREGGNEYFYYPFRGEDTVSDFLAFLKDRTDFSNRQLSALRAVYEGPINPKTGERIYNGMPIGSERYDCGICGCENEEPPHFYPFIWAFGKEYDPYSFDFGADMETLETTLSPVMNATGTDLSAFRDAGGKLLMYSGTADPCVPFPDAAGYYEAVCEKMGGYGKVSDFFRFFLVNGMDHGEGGRGAKTVFADEALQKKELDALRDWAENGIAPNKLYAVGQSTDGNAPAFCEPVFPYLSDACPKRPLPPHYLYK